MAIWTIERTDDDDADDCDTVVVRAETEAEALALGETAFRDCGVKDLGRLAAVELKPTDPPAVLVLSFYKP